jgi:hypothetical protein
MAAGWVVHLAAIALVITAAGARAAGTDLEFYTGEELMDQCSATPADPDFQPRQARCAGYVMGVSDAVQAAQGAGGAAAVCIPAGTAAPQLVNAVQRFLEAHPDKRRFAAKDLVQEALAASFACR